MKSNIEDLDNNRKMLKLYDNLDIQNADELKTTLRESLEETDILLINIDSATNIDLSCLQLLCAVHKSAIQAGKTVVLNYSHSSVIAKTLNQAGYVRHTGCTDNEKCFWSEVSHE